MHVHVGVAPPTWELARPLASDRVAQTRAGRTPTAERGPTTRARPARTPYVNERLGRGAATCWCVHGGVQQQVSAVAMHAARGYGLRPDQPPHAGVPRTYPIARALEQARSDRVCPSSRRAAGMHAQAGDEAKLDLGRPCPAGPGRPRNRDRPPNARSGSITHSPVVWYDDTLGAPRNGVVAGCAIVGSVRFLQLTLPRSIPSSARPCGCGRRSQATSTSRPQPLSRSLSRSRQLLLVLASGRYHSIAISSASYALVRAPRHGSI